MEYSKSINKDGEIFESFIGTPEEIARLIKLLGQSDKKNQGLKHTSPIKSSPMISPNITINTPVPNIGILSLEEINKRLAEQVNKAFKTMKSNVTP